MLRHRLRRHFYQCAYSDCAFHLFSIAEHDHERSDDCSIHSSVTSAVGRNQEGLRLEDGREAIAIAPEKKERED